MNHTQTCMHRSLQVLAAMIFIHPQAWSQVSCQKFYEKTYPPSYFYYVGDFVMVNPGKLSSKCMGTGFKISFSDLNGKEYVSIGKHDDPNSNWSSESFTFPEKSDSLKTLNIPIWVSRVVNENIELIEKHRPLVAGEWRNYLLWKKSGSGGQDDPKSTGRGARGG